MLDPYREILAQPGALRFTLAGLIGRLPLPMVGLGIVLMVSALYGSYGKAGAVAAAFVVAQALCSPQLAKLVDRFGQARVMRPSLAVACLSTSGLIVAAILRAPDLVLYATAALGGATIGSIGALVRARWNLVVSAPRQLHTAYSLESALDELTFVGGPVIATVLATSVTPWSALVVPIVAAAVGGYWLLAQRATEPPPSGRPTRTGRGATLLSPAFVALLVIFLAVGVVLGGIDVAVVAFADERNVPSLAGPVLAAVALGSFLAALGYGSRTWNSPLLLRLAAGIAALAVGTAGLLFVDTILTLTVVGFLTGFAIAPTLVNGNSLVQLLVSPQRITEGFTWLTAAIGVGVSVGASVAGALIDRYASPGGFAMVAGAAAVALCVGLLAIPMLRPATGDRVSKRPDDAAPHRRSSTGSPDRWSGTSSPRSRDPAGSHPSRTSQTGR